VDVVTPGWSVADGEAPATAVVAVVARAWTVGVTAGALSDLATKVIDARSTTTDPSTTQAHHRR
jgi:hypothetical protein